MYKRQLNKRTGKGPKRRFGGRPVFKRIKGSKFGKGGSGGYRRRRPWRRPKGKPKAVPDWTDNITEGGDGTDPMAPAKATWPDGQRAPQFGRPWERPKFVIVSHKKYRV